MKPDATAVVEDYRRRIKAQAEVVRRLEELARGLETGPAAEGGAQTAAALRKARADLERAEKELKALKRDYARFRLAHALGPDPLHVEDAIFNEAILAATNSRLCRRETRSPMDGPIGFDAFRTLLLADLHLGQMVENEAADRRSAVSFEPLQEQTSTKNILRRWAAMVAGDPYVANILRCAAEATRRFRESLAAFMRGLEGLRIGYEMKKHGVDRLSFTLDGRRAAIQATSYWENVEQACPAEAAELLGHFYALDQAREELKRLRDELNGELRAFMRCFFPRFLGYVLSQDKTRQQELGLGRANARRLCNYVLEQIDRTDFLLPRGSDLEIEVPVIPPEIVAFRKAKSYLRFKRQREREEAGSDE